MQVEKIVIKKIDEVFFKIHTENYIKCELVDYFKFRPDGFQFVPAYKHKLWDGYIKLFNGVSNTLPIGLLSYLEEFAKDRDYAIEYDFPIKKENEFDEFYTSLNLPFELRDYQKKGIEHSINSERTLLLSPTGSGKSVSIYSITRWFNQKTLIIVPTLSLIQQMKSDFRDYSVNNEYDVDKEIHLVYGGQDKNVNKNVIIGTWQSLYKLPDSWFNDFKVVICDEAHLAKSDSIVKILKKLSNCPIRIGTTGTLDGTKVNQLTLEGYIGPVYNVTTTKELINQNYLSELTIECICLRYSELMCKDFYDKCSVYGVDGRKTKSLDYKKEIKYILSIEKRYQFIVNLIDTIKNNTLVLFEYVDDHGKILFEIIQKSIPNRNIYFIYGNTPADEREEIRKLIEQDKTAIVVASVKVFSTGVNIRNLDSVIFVSPSKSRIRTLQSIGRVLRIGDHSNKATLYDIVDDLSLKSKKNYALKHFIDRAKIYDGEKFNYNIHMVKI
jgi:superfamily II DNA or RNA helicase